MCVQLKSKIVISAIYTYKKSFTVNQNCSNIRYASD